MSVQERISPAALRRELGQPPKPSDPPAPRTALPRAHPEDSLQLSIVQWLGYSLRPGVMVHHSPNGGRRDVREARRLKAAGCVAGWPDLTLVWSEDWFTRDLSRVAFIEVKAPGGSLSAAQRHFRDWCQEGGVPWCLARSLEEVEAFVTGLGLTRRTKP